MSSTPRTATLAAASACWRGFSPPQSRVARCLTSIARCCCGSSRISSSGSFRPTRSRPFALAETNKVVLGASDGLTTNLSLVMGVAGANLRGHTILFTGLAGMLAGALSMAIGEWLSVQSARELYTHQIEVERQELADIPQEEQEELALIYQAKGVEPEAARQLAARIIAADKQDGKYEAALDTLAREELVIDPKELGGSPWEAAITSFMLFAVGAAIPVLPFVFGSGWMAVLVSLFLGILGLFIVGIGITLTTGASLLKSGGRQVLLGLLAAAITFGLGWLVGGRLA